MTEKQYSLSEKLKADKHIHVKLLSLKQQFEILSNDDMVSAVSYESDGSQPQHNTNHVEDKYIKRDEQLEKIRKDISDAQEELSEPMKRKRELFDSFDDSVLYAVMSMLYISFLKPDKVAELIPCDVRSVYRYRNKALDILNKKLS